VGAEDRHRLPVDERAFRIHPLNKDTMLAILPPGTKNPPMRMTPARLVSAPLVLESEGTNQSLILREWLRDAGFEARPIMEFDNIEAIKAVVAAGLGQAVIPGQALSTPASRRHLIVRPLHPPLSYTFALIHRRDRPLDDATKIVMKELATLGKARR